MDNIIFTLEVIGTIAFAISGSIVGIKKQVDIFGVVFLGITTAVGGGITRDIILGQTPPLIFSNYTIMLLAFLSCVATYIFVDCNKKYFLKKYSQIDNIVNVFDAIGLGIFTIGGMNTAIFNANITNGLLIIFVGLITSVGGGIIRDILINDIPFVLRKKIYALASIVGGVLYYILYLYNINSIISTVVGVVVVFAIRMGATKFLWNLPKINLDAHSEK